jgi:UDP-glucose 4-epimerase
VFTSRSFDAVMHFCAKSLVGESSTIPYDYYDNNVVGTLNLLRAMHRHGVDRLVFSSTAAVYGQPGVACIDEDCSTQPINTYGHSKLMVERILRDAASAYGLRSVSLRYFNAAGATATAEIGEAHQPETHLVPNVLRAILGRGPWLKVFGDDYATPDGTCVRDYVHVEDLAQAHELAMRYLESNAGAFAFNLGSGRGFSVREVIAVAEEVTGQRVPYEIAPRRSGDPAILVASSTRARSTLGWRPAHAELGSIIESAWRWHINPRY